MRKIISLLIFSLLLLADDDGRDKYMFPDAFMKDNNLVYNEDDDDEDSKMDVIRSKPKKKEKVKKKEPINMGINNMQYLPMAPMNSINRMNTLNGMNRMYGLNGMNPYMKQKTRPMTLIYISPTFIKRKDINLVGIGLGFLINDWINTELLVETSLADKKLQLYDITNEYSINLLGTKYLRANLLTAVSTGGILTKKDKVEKFFFAYGVGAEFELVMEKIKLVGTYRFETFERKNTKAIKSNIYAVKVKFNFPF